NIIPFCLAIADTTGKRTLDIFSGSAGGHALELLHPNNADITIGKITIDSIRLDDFLSDQKVDQIDFLKMNCEGAEYEILFTCPDQVISKIKKISMQYHPIDEKRNENTLRKFLEEKGFKVTTRQQGSMLYAERR
ncbi:MAG: FkbM family methyltransferase, partial [bacterium]|nr:FkbM family methyltransferase [bacterium]